MKLYIITRSDISPGLRAAQSCHALSLFAEEHPGPYKRWSESSNNLVVLEVDDEAALQRLLSSAQAQEVAVSAFHEPDLDDAMTALALSWEGQRLVSNIRLALRDVA